MSVLKKICVLGSGNWGSAIAKVIGENVLRKENLFMSEVRMWVYEENFEGRNLSEIINVDHENKKYLPGVQLPHNVVAITDSSKAVEDADLIVVVVPHQFVGRICAPLKNKIKKGALGVSLIKGLDVTKDGVKLFSDIISDALGIEVGVLSGANVANEVAREQFCESTLAFKNREDALPFLSAIENENLQLEIIEDVAGAQVCGALKNIVALAAGTSDGLGYTQNTKAAVIRIGLSEMRKFISAFFPQAQLSTLFESCGFADLVVTCFAGRNRRAAETHARTGQAFSKLEEELFGGQSLQGVTTSKEVYELLSKDGLCSEYPLFTAVYKICYEGLHPKDLLRLITHG